MVFLPSLVLSILWAFYLAHECAHLLIFKSRRANYIMGEALAVVNGTVYTSFHEYRLDHLRHHHDKLDLLGLDVKSLLLRWPKIVQKIILSMEFVYIPVCYLVVKGFSIMTILYDKSKEKRLAVKLRVCFYLFFNIILIMVLFMWWPNTLLVLIVAGAIRTHIVRFVDAFQHSFEQIPPEMISPLRSRYFELRNTFSLPLARKYTWLNLIILNFGYHKEHHLLQVCPWYCLPKLFSLLNDNKNIHIENKISFWILVKAFHRGRIERILSSHEGVPYLDANNFSMAHFTGAYTDKLLG